jgi:hypothetical protein
MSNPAPLSERGSANVAAIMPKIKGAVAERTRKDNVNIDLSTAENWLLRPELVVLCKNSIVEGFEASVSTKKILLKQVTWLNYCDNSTCPTQGDSLAILIY